MKRDMDVVREVLIAVEKHPAGEGWLNVEIPGRSAVEISYHVKLLSDAGYIDAHNLNTQQDFTWLPESLTWEGHEFLDAIRNDTVWSKTKKAIADKGGSIPFELLKELAITLARTHFLGPGV